MEWFVIAGIILLTLTYAAYAIKTYTVSHKHKSRLHVNSDLALSEVIDVLEICNEPTESVRTNGFKSRKL